MLGTPISVGTNLNGNHSIFAGMPMNKPWKYFIDTCICIFCQDQVADNQHKLQMRKLVVAGLVDSERGYLEALEKLTKVTNELSH